MTIEKKKAVKLDPKRTNISLVYGKREEALGDVSENGVKTFSGTITADIFTEPDGDKGPDSHRHEIGEFSLTIIDLNFIPEVAGCDVFTALDDLDLNICRVYTELFQDGSTPTKEFWRTIREPDDSSVKDSWPLHSLMYLEHVYIEPEFRGQGIGLAVTRHLLQVWRNQVTATVIEVSPLQFKWSLVHGEGWVPSIKDDEELEPLGLTDKKGLSIDQAATNLTKYFRELGFKPVKGTLFMGNTSNLRLPEAPAAAKPWIQTD